MSLLHITAKGIQQLIKCRNDEVYTQSKTMSQESEITETKQRSVQPLSLFKGSDLGKYNRFSSSNNTRNIQKHRAPKATILIWTVYKLLTLFSE